ncbi:SoxR reducing system RseC family protein [Uliginosibacterium paludis]|uniref:SoxR reducing system RseC family protein n=1 Tax=Uliginosibacterium paludis TaxID=1615952 RepID=A0ABV2CLS1_9RHOO
MQADGVVVGSAAGVARVRVQRSGGCGRCNEPGGCGNAADSRCDEFVVLNELNVRPGDRVLIDIPEGAALRAAMLAYGLPLCGTVLGAIAGFAAGGSDMASLAGAAAGLLLAFAGVRLGRSRGVSRPRIAEIL